MRGAPSEGKADQVLDTVFLSPTDGSFLLKLKTGILSACILKNWKQFDPQTLKKNYLTFFCTWAWPQYNLSDGEAWPPERSINYKTILQLHIFFCKEGK